jgi:uncharacterized protein YjiS (DUF1127 family)
MSNVMVTLSAIASGLASIAAVTGYSLAASGIAFVGAPPALEEHEVRPLRKGILGRTFGAFSRPMRRSQTIDAMLSLDDHLLRDIGLTRGILVSIASADGGARGLYSDMIQHRLRQF